MGRKWYRQRGAEAQTHPRTCIPVSSEGLTLTIKLSETFHQFFERDV